MWDEHQSEIADAGIQTFDFDQYLISPSEPSEGAAKADPLDTLAPQMTGSTTVSGVTITGYRHQYSYWEDASWFGWDGYDTSGDVYVPEVYCGEVNYVTGVDPVDNVRYYLPEGVTADYINNAINHLRQFDPMTNRVGLLAEFRAMYEDPSHEFFLDFKRWDDAHPGASNPTVTYYSEASGAWVTASAFEAAGNLFYGVIGITVGISDAELWGAAAYTQTGNSWWNFMFRGDDTQDRPHVERGIQLGHTYNGNPSSLIGVDSQNCG